jgi:hypothetical protein
VVELHVADIDAPIRSDSRLMRRMPEAWSPGRGESGKLMEALNKWIPFMPFDKLRRAFDKLTTNGIHTLFHFPINRAHVGRNKR